MKSGYIHYEPQSTDWATGSQTHIKLEDKILGRKWSDFRSQERLQHFAWGDNMSCTIHALVESQQAQLNRMYADNELTGKQKEWFERYSSNGRILFSIRFISAQVPVTRIGSNISVAVNLYRKIGIIPNFMLPNEKAISFDDFQDSKHITSDMIKTGQEFLSLFEPLYEYITFSTDSLDLTQHLKQAPLCIARDWEGDGKPDHMILLEDIINNEYQTLDHYLPFTQNIPKDQRIYLIAKCVLFVKKSEDKIENFKILVLPITKSNKVDVKQLQKTLRYIGLFSGVSDGILGTYTIACIKKFQTKYGLLPDGIFGAKSYDKMCEVIKQINSSNKTKSDEPEAILSLNETLYNRANKEIGTKEIRGIRENPQIIKYHSCTDLKATSDEVAWCSSFVNYIANECGAERTNKANARSWLLIGQKVTEPIRGDIVILKRGNSTTQGHVGFFDRMENGYIYLLGGNQSDSVSVTKFSLDSLLGYRRLGIAKTGSISDNTSMFKSSKRVKLFIEIVLLFALAVLAVFFKFEEKEIVMMIIGFISGDATNTAKDIANENK